MAAHEDGLFLGLGAEDLVNEGDTVRGDGFGGVGGEGLGGGGAAVAWEVGDDDPEVEMVHQVGDLIAPAEGEVGPAVEEEDGGFWGGGGLGEEVVVCFGVDGGGVVGDAGVGGC